MPVYLNITYKNKLCLSQCLDVSNGEDFDEICCDVI